MRPSQVARVHLKPIASCKTLARLKSITAYRGTSNDAHAPSLAVTKLQHPFNETDLEMGQNDVDIAMDLENFANSSDGDTDAIRSYFEVTASDICLLTHTILEESIIISKRRVPRQFNDMERSAKDLDNANVLPLPPQSRI